MYRERFKMSKSDSEFSVRMKKIMELKKGSYRVTVEVGGPVVDVKVAKIRGKKVWVTTPTGETVKLDGPNSLKILNA
jgi:hypothetical protein